MERLDAAFSAVQFGYNWVTPSVVLAVRAPLRQALQELLATEIYQLTSIEADASLVDRIEQAAPDVLILEAGFGGVDSHRLLHQLRGTAALADMPILMFVDGEAPNSVARLVADGADDITRLPFDPVGLSARVRLLAEVAQHRRRSGGETFYQRFVSHVANGLMTVDRIGTIGMANFAAARLLGMDADELIGQNLLSLMAIETGRVWLEGLRYVLSTGMPFGPVNVRFVRRDGTDFVGELRLAAMDWSGHTGLALSLVDVSAQTALQEERDRERGLLVEQSLRVATAFSQKRRVWSRRLVDGVLTPLGAVSLGQETTGFDKILDECRSIVETISPPLLHDSGLSAALAERVQRSELPVDFEAQIDGAELHPVLEEAVYGLVDEALTMLDGRADVSRVSVYLWLERAVLCLELDHDGEGFCVGELETFLPSVADIQLLGGCLTESGADSAAGLFIEFPVGA